MSTTPEKMPGNTRKERTRKTPSSIKITLYTWQEISGIIQPVSILTLIRPIESLVGPDDVRRQLQALSKTQPVLALTRH